jgi:hypothetical protein
LLLLNALETIAAESAAVRVLHSKFSSGVRLGELRSVALVLASLAHVSAPGRDTNRQYSLLMRWYDRNWTQIAPFLPLVQLRDADGRPIDAHRELAERHIIV